MKSLLEFAPQIRTMYVDEKQSIRYIAKQLHTYPIAIYRVLKELNIPVRDKSEAAKTALESGRAVHPTKGKNLSKETKEKIGASVSDSWGKMSDDKKKDISEKHKEIWESRTEEEKENLSKKSHAAIAESARIGSKMERFLVHALTEKGYNCYPHTKVLENQSLEVDLALPDLRIAVELDGPSHFLPIWGDDILQKTKRADKEKNGLLMLNGYTVIRISYDQGYVTNLLKNKVLDKLVETIESAKISSEQLYYIHV